MGSTGGEQLYNLTWGEFSHTLSSTLQTLRCHGDLVDVTLTAGGKIFPAHKLVLGAASPLFMELLKSTKCEHPVVMLAGITAMDLEALLQFVYNGEVSVDPGQLPSLLQAAQCLNIQALSPSILSVDKNGQPLMASFHDSNSTRPMISPFVSVRKKRKKSSTSCSEEGGSSSCSSKEPPDPKRSPLVSDLPVSCNICGVTLRQSRNLRRHMELMHLKPGSERKQKGRKGVEITQQIVEPSNVNSGNQNQQQPIGNNSQQGSVETNNSIGSNESRVTEIDNRMNEQRPIDNRQQIIDPRMSTEHAQRLHDGRQDMPHYPSSSLCEPIHPFLHIDPAYMNRPAELYRHQQA